MMRKILKIAAPAVLLTAIMTAPASATYSAPNVQLVNRQTGLCLTIAGGVSTANNVQAVQYTCDSHPSRRWDVFGNSTTYLQVRNRQTGKCLTIAGGTSTANNLEAVQYDCDLHASRGWTFGAADGGGGKQLVNVWTGKCLTIAGGVSTANNVVAVQYTCDGHPSRYWEIRD
ncbi:RICIN domain-containing protein [Nonomuraea sp. NPDC050536]|uniref:RICIN domain-containing protein n=1 Tax=Nonomuraea sp. NPDC050536 TaxID=3364366 RepID=UPI0037CACEA3